MNHFLLNVEMSEWRSSTEQGIKEYGPCNVALRTLAGAEWRASFPLRRQSQANSVSFL
jgi:hypothetical protein